MKRYKKLLFLPIPLLLLPLFYLFPAFAESFSTTVGAFFRLLLGGFSSLLPFSLFEVLVVLFAVFVVTLLILLPVFFLSKNKKGMKKVGKCFLSALLVLVIVLDLFCLTFAASYRRESLAEHLSLDTDKVNGESVFVALSALRDTVNESAPSLSKNKKGESIAPDFDLVKEEVRAACDTFGEKHDFFQKKGYKVKSFLSSPLMTYTHISGIFGFFTGEACVNTNYPHFIVTACAAHESCHARGIAPENECNFLAAVVLMESEDPYLRYCGASFLLDDLISAARKLDKDRANAILSPLDDVFWRDMAAYSAFFEPYRDSAASKVADAGNNAYLKSLGQKEGVISYSRVVRLTCAWFEKALEK